MIDSEKTYIGRDPIGGIKIADTKISRKHALINCEHERYFLEDLGSQNGTFLNNQAIQKARLNSHDKITIGNRTFLFLMQPSTIGELLMDPSIAATDTIALSKVTLVSQNVRNDLRFRDSDSIRIHNLRSIVCAPMTSMKNVIGLLYAESRSILNPMSQEDAVFASAVANELALNIDNISLQQKALRNEQMAAIGLTVSNLAHNIRNLIALNQSAVQLMGVQLKEMANPKIDKNWEWIQQGFSGINRLSAGMLEYVKEDQYQLQPTDINKSILKNRKVFEQSLSHDQLKIEFLLSRKNPVWMMDEAQLQRALFNLVINAADAVKDKKAGRIRISKYEWTQPMRCCVVVVRRSTAFTIL